MKSKEKKMILILIVVSVIIIAILWFVTRGKENNNENGNGGNSGTTIQNAEQGEFTKVEEDGTIVNTSETLKQNKENIGFTITNINFVKKGNETILTARVTNNTGTEQEGFLGQIVLLDKNGNEMGRIPAMITETQSGEAIDIETSITESYANAYDFRLEK